MTREELERRLESAEKQNLGLLDEIKWLKEKLESRLEEAEKQMIGLQDEIANLKAKLAEVEDDKEIPEYPEFDYGDTLYAADADCSGETKIRHMEITAKVSHKVYDVFHEDLYAKEYAGKCKLIAMLLHCKWYVDRDYTPDWDNEDEEKWMVFWSNTYKKYEVCDWGSDEYSSVFFSTEEAAQKCADWMNAHWKESTDE